VNQQTYRGKTGTPKGRTRRTVPMTTTLHEALKRMSTIREGFVVRNLDGKAKTDDQAACAIERICRTFFTRLARITSPAACQALLSRAVHIPRGEFVFLEEVRAASAGEPLIDGLRASLDGVDVVFARAGLEAVLGTLIDLLASFVGQDLTLSMLHKDWPGLLVVKPHSPPHLAGCGRMVDR